MPVDIISTGISKHDLSELTTLDAAASYHSQYPTNLYIGICHTLDDIGKFLHSRFVAGGMDVEVVELMTSSTVEQIRNRLTVVFPSDY